ncbi:MAG: hypothetical protein LIP10_03480 [Clostridiales bacterium]|nr:hypothetical protein [Clostridiales bacterium]
MSKITWDGTGERRYETGTDHGVLYKKDSSGAYPSGVAWNGLTAVTESPGGAEETALYADNIKYGSLRSAETFDYTIEAYTYPPEWEECDGSAELATGVYVGQQKRSAFGFTYRSQIGDDTDEEAGYKLHLVYNSTASPSEKSRSTVNDSPEAITFSWECSTTPIPCTGFKNCSTITIDSTKVDATKLAALEDILYGTDDTEAYLPLPDDVMALFAEDAA